MPVLEYTEDFKFVMKVVYSLCLGYCDILLVQEDLVSTVETALLEFNP